MPRIQSILEPVEYLKFCHICKEEMRTESKMASYIIHEYIKEYEAEHGEIVLPTTINNDNITQQVTNNGYMNIGIQNNQK